MNTFTKELLEPSRTTTDNGAIARSTTGAIFLDAFFSLPLMREDEQRVRKVTRELFANDKLLTLRMAFYIRAIRGTGTGERTIFRWMLSEMSKLESNILDSVIDRIPVYGRWDDLFYDSEFDNHKVLDYIIKTLKEDIAKLDTDQPISLLAKWLPTTHHKPRKTVNRKEKDAVVKAVYKAMGWSEKDYRKIIGSLRSKIGIVEHMIISGKVHHIDYSKIPSCSHKQYRRIFEKMDRSRYREYLTNVARGEAKIKSTTLTPGELVKMSIESGNSSLANGLWDALPSITPKSTILPIIDSSGSMYNDAGAIYNSLGLGLYVAKNNLPEFKNIFGMFSTDCEFFSFEDDDNLSDILKMIPRINAMTTNLKGVFEFILKAARTVPAEQLPSSILVLTDMQFDSGVSDYDTLYEEIKKEFEQQGVTIPRVIWWNLSLSEHNALSQNKYDDKGVIMVAGNSFRILSAIMEGKDITPLANMMEVLSQFTDIILPE